MQVRSTKTDLLFLIAAFIFLIVAAMAGRTLFGDTIFVVMPIVASLLVMAVVLEAYRRLEEDIRASRNRLEAGSFQDYRQIEALLSLQNTLKPSLPFPATRDWAASPDLLKTITEIILSEKPGLIVEASSGVSTLVAAYCLRQLGKGRVISLEHDPKYAAITRSLIEFHGLQDIATVADAPLKEYRIKDQTWLWYDTNAFTADEPADLFVIDGPPSVIQPLARYPALPLMHDRLAEHAVIVLDDGGREDERKIMASWNVEFPDLSAEFVDLEKGAFIIRKGGARPNA
jgi:hypothetical protein